MGANGSSGCPAATADEAAISAQNSRREKWFISKPDENAPAVEDAHHSQPEKIVQNSKSQRPVHGAEVFPQAVAGRLRQVQRRERLYSQLRERPDGQRID